jgi:iron complex outermembrane recepter protein
VNARNLTDETYNLAQALTTTDSFAGIRVGTSTPFSLTASLAWEF